MSRGPAVPPRHGPDRRASGPSQTSCDRPGTPFTRPTCSTAARSAASRRASDTPGRSASARSSRAGSVRPRSSRPARLRRILASACCRPRGSRRPGRVPAGHSSSTPASRSGVRHVARGRAGADPRHGRRPVLRRRGRPRRRPRARRVGGRRRASCSSIPATSTTSPTRACRATTRVPRGSSHSASSSSSSAVGLPSGQPAGSGCRTRSRSSR